MTMALIIIALDLLLLGWIMWRLFGSRFTKTVTVPAQVESKHSIEFYSKTAPGGKLIKYSVVFLVDGKKKSFYVSEFSYNGYRKGEKGTLTYQGNRLIEFEH